MNTRTLEETNRQTGSRNVGRKRSESPKSEEPPKPVRTGVSLHVYVDPRIRAILDEHAEHERRSLTTLVEMAVELYHKHNPIHRDPS